MKTMASIIWILAAAVAMRASGETSSDDELKREILLFMRPIECVEMVRGARSGAKLCFFDQWISVDEERQSIGCLRERFKEGVCR